MARNNIMHYKGSKAFRMRLILSILSGKALKISDIRSLDDEPGLREYEINLIRLIDKITNGSTVEVNETGTGLFLQPGLLHGGNVVHECCKLKPISYYLEVLLAVAPFCKNPLSCTLTGVTNSKDAVSIDSYINGALPVLKKFIITDDGLELKVLKRGMAPEGGGEVSFKCPAKKQLHSVQVTDMGKVKRVRGVVYTCRVSPAIANRIVDAAKGVLLKFLPDVYINTDHCQRDKSGKSPGFGISLVAETTNGVFLTCDYNSGLSGDLAEDIGIQGGNLLLDEVFRGGCVSSSFQSLVALWMFLTHKDVSKFLTGPLSPYMITFLKHVRDFFGVTFKLETMVKEEEEEQLKDGATKVMLTCLGIGYTNINKRTL